MTNHVAAARNSRFRGNEMAALDRLPPALRYFLHDSVVAWDARWVLWELNKMRQRDDAVAALLQRLRDSQAVELASFRHHWPARFGVYPAFAARASVVHYDEADRVRAARQAAP